MPTLQLYQLSTINYPLSTIHYQLSTINYQLSTIHYQLSNGLDISTIVNPVLSETPPYAIITSIRSVRKAPWESFSFLFGGGSRTSVAINCQLSTVNYQLSTINCQLSTVNYQLSTAIARKPRLCQNPPTLNQKQHRMWN